MSSAALKIESSKTTLFDQLGSSWAAVEIGLDDKIIKTSEQFCAALNYGAEDLIGKKFSSFLKEEATEEKSVSLRWQAAKNGDLQKPSEFRFISKKWPGHLVDGKFSKGWGRRSGAGRGILWCRYL